MMNGLAATWAASWLAGATQASLALLMIALLLSLWRAARGPRQSDRLAALMHAWLVVIGFMAVLTLATKDWRILDVALALSLLGGVVPLASAWAARRHSPGGAKSAEPAGGTHVGDH